MFVGGGYGLNVTGTSNGNSFSENTTTGSQNHTPGFHVMGGGDFGYAVTKSVFVVGEASYFPSLSPAYATNTSGGVRTDYTYDRKVVEFNGGIHYRLGLAESRFVPYLAAGIGAAHFMASTVTSSATVVSTGSSTPGNSYQAPGATAFEIAAGGGARLYLSEHFGFRGEFRLYHPFGISNIGTFFRATGGIFFQFK